MRMYNLFIGNPAKQYANSEEEDEETMEWEREQLRRGGTLPDARETSPAKQVYKPAMSK